MLAERLSLPLARRLLGPLLLLGLFSDAHWYWGEYHGAGDLRLYALVQFGSLLLIALLLLLYPSKYAGSEYLQGVGVAVGLADVAALCVDGIDNARIATRATPVC